jgi:hypothetical protein
MVLLELAAPERSSGGDVREKPPVYWLLLLFPCLQDAPKVIVVGSSCSDSGVLVSSTALLTYDLLTFKMPFSRSISSHRSPSNSLARNPPFIGDRYIRKALGDGYVEMLRAQYNTVPKTCDFVMYWWDRAATLVGKGEARRCGLMTTNSISQSYSRGLLKHTFLRRAMPFRYCAPFTITLGSTRIPAQTSATARMCGSL